MTYYDHIITIFFFRRGFMDGNFREIIRRFGFADKCGCERIESASFISKCKRYISDVRLSDVTR